MSVGEIMNLYRDREIKIDPSFQRLFRWDATRKTRFIESLLLGIPIPPIFVYQDQNGGWELIDGLQRLSTVLEFTGQLRLPDHDEKLAEPTSLDGTRLLPSLQGKRWEPTTEEGQQTDGIGTIQQLQIKRARIRVEILKQESDSKAKFELFQRLNTGGAELSPQEVRNCVAVMLNKDFYAWLVARTQNSDFLETIDQTEYALQKQIAAELVLRFVTFRAIPYDGRLDVHEYLDDALIDLARDAKFDWSKETEVFNRTFSLLKTAQGDKAFKRWNGLAFTGKFLMSVFEIVGTGVASHLDAIEQTGDPSGFIIERSKKLWGEETFTRYSGAGIRGTTRLNKLIPFASAFFKP
jgi:uncharacterized protein with ParB-like and HNH nuclease domain